MSYASQIGKVDKFAIVATFEVAEGRMDEFLPLLLAHRDRCLKDEPGTLRFDVLRPRNEENTIMLYEVYEDDAAFQVHWNGPSVARMRADTTGMVAKLTGIRCAPLG
jgi:quinol monooxygenase YgiN